MSSKEKIKEKMKEKMILKRLDRVYCKLKPSPVHGIGIFSIKTIPSGINPFKDSYMAQEAIVLPKKKIKEEYKTLLNDYHPSRDNNQVVSNWPNQIIWTNYLNYSEEPNIELMTNGEWLTLRIIEKGEELLEDPSRLFDSENNHKTFSVTPGQYPKIIN